MSVASAEAATKQQSLAPLFANLGAVAAPAAICRPALQQAVLQVLAQQTPLDTDLDGGDIQNAVQKSGLFLEASLAAGSLPPTGMPDLKAALIVLRQTLAAASDKLETPQAAAPAVATAAQAKSKPQRRRHRLFRRSRSKRSPSRCADQPSADRVTAKRARNCRSLMLRCDGATDQALVAEALLGAEPKSVTSGAALNLLQEALQNLPRAIGNVQTATVTLPGGQSEEAIVHTNTPPPPFRGALPSAQPVAAPSIAPDAPLATTVHHLLDDTDAAIARQTLLQVASLPDRPDASGQSHRSDRAALEFRNPVRDAAGHRDGAVRNLARRRRQRGRSRQTRLAGALLAQCRAGRSRACADLADRRPHLGADVGGAAADRARSCAPAQASSARR